MSEEASNQPLKMIPTLSKSQISPDFAFPIGAEALSQGLAGVPQFDFLTLEFEGLKEVRRSTADGKEALRLISITYRRPPITLANTRPDPQRRDPSEIWELSVSPVGRGKRFEIKQLLLGEGIQILREWMTLPRSQAWRESSHTLTIEADVDEKRLIFSESAR